jgi:hypothetical protein
MRRKTMRTSRLRRQEEGGIMLAALVMLVLMGIIGMAASSSSTTEFRIAANERLYRIAFYAADGATEAGTVLLERSIEGRSTVSHTSGQAENVCTVDVRNDDFWTNLNKPPTEDIRIKALGRCDVNLLFWRERAAQERSSGSQPTSGGALPLMAGYEGRGKAAGAGGAFIDYDIGSQSMTTAGDIGSAGARAKIRVKWRHVI